MPTCKTCCNSFDGAYRKKYCSLKCQFLYYVPGRSNKETCWLWTGAKTTAKYGMMNIESCGIRKLIYAHRISFELFNGSINGGLLVLHRCDNPSCVNPNHLFLGTQTDNMKDSSRKGRSAFYGKSRSKEDREKIKAGLTRRRQAEKALFESTI